MSETGDNKGAQDAAQDGHRRRLEALERHRAALDPLAASKHGLWSIRAGSPLLCRPALCCCLPGPDACDVRPEGGCVDGSMEPCARLQHYREAYIARQVEGMDGDLTAADEGDIATECLCESISLVGEAALARFGPLVADPRRRSVGWQPLTELLLRSARMASDLRDRRLSRLRERRRVQQGGDAGAVARALAGMASAKPEGR